MIQNRLELISQRNLYQLVIRARESVEFCKQSVMDDSAGIPEDQNVCRNTFSDYAHEVLGRNKDCVGN